VLRTATLARALGSWARLLTAWLHRVGPGGYFLNFTEYGLQINNGHEVMMDRCWLGETNFDFDHEAHGVSPNATAIQIVRCLFSDQFLCDSLIRSCAMPDC
jgi:hypothetical protein